MNLSLTKQIFVLKQIGTGKRFTDIGIMKKHFVPITLARATNTFNTLFVIF